MDPRKNTGNSGPGQVGSDIAYSAGDHALTVCTSCDRVQVGSHAHMEHNTPPGNLAPVNHYQISCFAAISAQANHETQSRVQHARHQSCRAPRSSRAATLRGATIRRLHFMELCMELLGHLRLRPVPQVYKLAVLGRLRCRLWQPRQQLVCRRRHSARLRMRRCKPPLVLSLPRRPRLHQPNLLPFARSSSR